MYYLYWSYGGCNEGDHSWGLEGFGTWQEAQAEGWRLQALYNEYDGFLILRGEDVTRGEPEVPPPSF